MPGTLGWTSQSIDFSSEKLSMRATFYQAPVARTTRIAWPVLVARMKQSEIRGKPLHKPKRRPRIARPKPGASSGLLAGYLLRCPLLQQRRDRFDAIAGVFRQPRADRISSVERTVAGEHLRGHQIAQDGNVFQLLF